ncbi:MAG: PTS mannose/fructose/sorbose transporter subunit IIB [Calditrichaeota bacterium]|nr:MAG: PTS mannose/fructose/sorbose transporter subunit IIB [Calditrichota bacterium]
MERSAVMLRIDDRLIHGQVLVGWGTYYPIKRIVVANDEVAENEWERNLLMMAASPEFETRILSLKEGVAFIHEHLHNTLLNMVLVKSPGDVKRMVDYGLQLKHINVGGVHFVPGENHEELLPYVFLSPRDIEVFKELIRKGYTFECQDLPQNPRYDLAELLEKKQC